MYRMFLYANIIFLFFSTHKLNIHHFVHKDSPPPGSNANNILINTTEKRYASMFANIIHFHIIGRMRV